MRPPAMAPIFPSANSISRRCACLTSEARLQRSLLLVPHQREAARQHAAIAHRAEQLPGGDELGAPALQPFVIGAEQPGGEALDRRRLLAAPPGQ